MSMILTGGLQGPVQAETFGPLADGDVSGLIDAIDAANATGVPDTILLARNGIYTLSSTADARIPFADAQFGHTGLPSITSTITIDGKGAVIERDASLFTDPEDRCSSALDRDRFRIITVEGTGTLTLNEATLQNGCPEIRISTSNPDGGGIFNEGTLTLTNSMVHSNRTRRGFGGFGGGIFNSGDLTLTHSTVNDNIAGHGGGIASLGSHATVNLTHSTVRSNTARNFFGGGILNSGPLTLMHSTVSDNTARSGGGIWGGGTLTNSTVSGNTVRFGGFNGGGGIGIAGTLTLTLINSTVSNNAARDAFGGGIFIRTGGTMTLTNSIIMDQVAGADCAVDPRTPTSFGIFTSNDFNLDSDGTCHLDQVHDNSSNLNANLGRLRVNAPGTTATHALLEGSAAIDLGNCSGGTITHDQRGVPRPQGTACDIGAFELSIPLGCLPPPIPDLNQDGVGNILDVSLVDSCVGQDPTASAPCQEADLNNDGTIDTMDMNLVRGSAEPMCPLSPDLNQDGVVNILDVIQVGSCVGQDPTASAPCQGADLNNDGTIDTTDMNFVRSNVEQRDF